jgi:hydrogenase 3 maturation protease
MSNSFWREQLKAKLQLLAKTDPARPVRLAVLGIGNELNGDDAAGVLVVRVLRARLGDQPQVLLIEAGLAPENFTGVLRRFEPDLVMLVDAAEMGSQPGEVAWVEWQETGGLSASTHSLPPTVLSQYLIHELGCQVGLIGIQPASLEFDQPLSAAVLVGVGEIVEGLKQAVLSSEA